MRSERLFELGCALVCIREIVFVVLPDVDLLVVGERRGRGISVVRDLGARFGIGCGRS